MLAASYKVRVLRECHVLVNVLIMSLKPVSIQTQSLALRALRKRKPQETQALALASSQSWLPLLDRAFLLAGACVCCVKRLRFLRFSFTQRTRRTQRKRLRLNGNLA